MRPRYTLDYLLKVLLKRGILTQEQAEQVVLHQSGQRFRLEKEAGALVGRQSDEVSPGQLLGSFELVTDRTGAVLTEDRVMQLLASEIGLPYMKIDPLKLDADLITSTLSLPYARKHRLLPIGRVGTSLRVATDNPFNLEAFESVRSMIGGTVEVVLASKTDIQRCIREIYGFRQTLRAAEQDLGVGPDLGNLERLFKLKSFDEIEATDRHIVNAVDYLFHYALDQRASDIHIEPKRDRALVRLRIDGVLHTVNKIPDVVHKAMVSRIKTMARLDIAEKRRPQDGRIKMGRQDVEVELRVATLPVAFGEKLVIRIFDPMVLLQDLDQIGFEGEELANFQSFVARPNGLVLVTGPTGSGKTTTLYSVLQMLATERVNVVTIEDPIEMVVEEFNQTAVQPKVGITFAAALRTILRQDPDIIMVGEIRDEATAQQAIQAALTGHLVLSTLHTNDTGSSVTRLVDLGIEPFLVASTLTGVLAQRLVRKVCEECKTKSTLSPEQMMALGMPVPDDGPPPELPVFYGQGCSVCRHTGLYGRVGVFEVMPITSRQQKLIIKGESAAELMKAARQDGMKTLREAAIGKLASGVTSFEEVLRVTAD